MIKKSRWHTPCSKILRWTRWCNSFFDWEPNSWPKNDIYSVTPPKVIFGCQAINVIFWPWNRLPIEKRVAPACSAQNFTIGGMSPQFFYHFPIGSRNASSTKTLIFILQKIRVFQLVAPPLHDTTETKKTGDFSGILDTFLWSLDQKNELCVGF